MDKPKLMRGYTREATLACERVLVTLLRGLGPYRDSVFLIGGLTPRYLVAANPPDVPEHAGTQDVDVVIDLQILANTDAYATLEQNLKRMGFERGLNAAGATLSWRWQRITEAGTMVMLEFLADDPKLKGGKVQVIPSQRDISALNIPHSAIVFDMHDHVEITAELLDGAGISKETVKHANLVAFVVLKCFAFDQRAERKDAHDLVYWLEYADASMPAIAEQFRHALRGPHAQVVSDALAVLRSRFTSDAIAGYRKDGPVAVALFEIGDGRDEDTIEARVLRQREVSALIERLIAAVS